MSDEGGDATKDFDRHLEEGPRQLLQIHVNPEQLQGANSANIEPATAAEEVKLVKKAAFPLFAVSMGTTVFLGLRSGHGNPGMRYAGIVFSELGLLLNVLIVVAVFCSEKRLQMHLKWVQICTCVEVFLLAFAAIISPFA